MDKTVCITGAARGIGFALSQEFLSNGYTVYGTVRSLDTAEIKLLQERKSFIPLLADIRKQEDLEKAKQSITSAIDILINNAAIMSPLELSDNIDLSQDALIEDFEVNVASQLRTSLAFRPLLQMAKDPIIANISSIVGSLGAIPDYGSANTWISSNYAYAVSKAALNMLTRHMGRRWRDIRVMCIHPGWVQTDMGGSNATLSPEESAKGIFEQVTSWDRDKPEFLDFQGNALPW